MIESPKESAACCPPEGASAWPEAGTAEGDALLATFAKALGHPARIAILRLLIAREACVCGEIVEELPLAQSTVSEHLKKLKAAGLIRGEISGPRTCYCVEPAAVLALQTLVASL